MSTNTGSWIKRLTGFRPLIRGFFFYRATFRLNALFASRFRPLIRGFFFYMTSHSWYMRTPPTVSVPSFGDSFFMGYQEGETHYVRLTVSVPSFGDSFFISIDNRMYVSSSKRSFRPLIRGFFFYQLLNFK